MTTMPEDMKDLVRSMLESADCDETSKAERQSLLRAARLVEGLYKNNDRTPLEESKMDSEAVGR